MGCEAQLALKCLFTPTFLRTILTSKLTQFLACDQGSLVGPCMQDYKSLCAAVAICSTLVNISDRHTHRQHLTSLFDKMSKLS